jgi:hypothetical protein
MARKERKTWVTCAKCGVTIRAEVKAVEMKGKENFICTAWCDGGNNDE